MHDWRAAAFQDVEPLPLPRACRKAIPTTDKWLTCSPTNSPSQPIAVGEVYSLSLSQIAPLALLLTHYSTVLHHGASTTPADAATSDHRT